VAEGKKPEEGLLSHLPLDGYKPLWAALAACGANALVLSIAPSATMRAFMGVAALVGFLLGVLLTAAAFKGMARYRRVRWCVCFSLAAFLFFASALFLSWVLDADSARAHEWVENFREQLIGPSTGANALMAIASGGGSFFLVCAFVILSPRLDKPSPRRHEVG
jgi:hypothetical protein